MMLFYTPKTSFGDFGLVCEKCQTTAVFDARSRAFLQDRLCDRAAAFSDEGQVQIRKQIALLR